jgi:hypothetical protein
MIGILSEFEVIKPQRDFMEKPYDSDEYNSHRCLLLLFLHCLSILYILNMIIYNSHEIHFGLL